jgi:hypothetical protein
MIDSSGPNYKVRQPFFNIWNRPSLCYGFFLCKGTLDVKWDHMYLSRIRALYSLSVTLQSASKFGAGRQIKPFFLQNMNIYILFLNKKIVLMPQSYVVKVLCVNRFYSYCKCFVLFFLVSEWAPETSLYIYCRHSCFFSPKDWILQTFSKVKVRIFVGHLVIHCDKCVMYVINSFTESRTKSKSFWGHRMLICFWWCQEDPSTKRN